MYDGGDIEFRYVISICYCLLFRIDHQPKPMAKVGKFKD